MQAWNTLKTTILLATLTGLLIVVGSALGGTGGMLIAFVLATAMNLGAWWFSDKLALSIGGAKPVSENEQPELHRMVETLSARAGIPKPAVYVIESDAPNAFATGRSPEKGAVAVTTGLLRLLDRDEVAGVVAHELAHIRHRDTLISSIVATIAGVITMLANMAQWALIFGGLGGSADDEDNGGSVFGSLIMIILAPIAAMLIQLAISRSREYAADAGGAQILGDPQPLADALEKLEISSRRAPMEVNPATSHLYIVNPLRGGLAGLFSTHPATQERVARLRAMTALEFATAQERVMRAEQIMTTDVTTVHADTTIEEVARLLTTRRIGSVPVVDDENRVVGVVNDEELFTSEKGIPFSAVRVPLLFEKWARPDRAEEIFANARQNTARDVMSYEFVCVDVNASVGHITQLMVERKLHRVLVTRSDRLAGIITRLDLIRMLANSG